MIEKDDVKVKYTLALIVRNCAENLEKLLDNFGKYPDEIVVVNTAVTTEEAGYEETNEVAKKFGARVFHFPWIHDFSAARNFSFSKASHPWVMWLDSDDVVENPAEVDANLRFAISTGSINALLMEYLYEFDEQGNCTLVLDRERVVKKDEFEWKAPVHEVLCATTRLQATRLPPDIGRVIHTRQAVDEAKKTDALNRNLTIFKEQFEATGKEPGLRMTFYWANTLLGLKRPEQALEKYLEYFKLSEDQKNGNPGELYIALWSCAETLRNLRRFTESFEMAGKAILLMPECPSAYMHASQALFGNGEHDRALTYSNLCREKAKNIKMEMVASPKGIAGIPNLLSAQVHALKGDWAKAIPYLEDAKSYYGDTPEFEEVSRWCDQMRDHHEDKAAFNRIVTKMWDEKKFRAVHSLAINAPGNLSDTGEVARLIPKKRPIDRQSIAFICGETGAKVTWGPWSVKSGIGGSEEAVINAAREFVKAGWHVEVYCPLGKKRSESPIIDDGVEYWPIHCWTGEYDNPIDVAIWWRAPRAVEVVPSRAHLNYAWLHDIYVTGTWGPDTPSKYDGVILLSEFHRSLHDFLPDDKVLLSGNGIDPKILVPLDKLVNHSHKMIWGSDPSRGLQYVLPKWKEIKDAVPSAELHVYYGWTPHFMAATKTSKWHKDTYDFIEANRNQAGIHWHGKVGQATLNKAYAECGIWGYPTSFPEIHCITALKAQAHGCTPIVTDDFALSQTVQYGEKLPGPMTDPENISRWTDRVIETMKNPWTREKRLEMATWARTHTWEAVVRGWLGHFEKHLALKPQAPRALSPTSTPAS